ncbi:MULTISPECIES: penicillin-binding protein 1A [unclassified Capnocytophaga]|uniref:penicillin-binding protein 1A n=1 Tax=unclassified Capnocytophaga TaxID=2640652 RepID=UPI000202D183|nr:MULTISPECIES: transglycosylase domain-containing protein [unclassified Capnocytophaga]EGD33820.1 bifunctional family GT51 b-glycosyltransferase/PBP transpeptidase [Capnocytophaga sp. oral taxon 338 str. F0234]MEB3004941.1 transglycosylase domain-containing protein [Capnocytophaga sp. G2]
MTTKKTTKDKTFFSRKRLLKYFWGCILGGIALVIFIFLLASWGALGEMPDFDHLENPETNLATEIISADGKTLGKFYFNDNRTAVTYKELPEHLVNALIATEDERFESHSGIDARGTLRAIVFLGRRGGASTITQQLAKLLFHHEGSKNVGKRYIQKIKEWIIAIRLERQYTKKEILTMYFNQYDFNNNADGIRSAARIYFGKEPKDLKIEEGAVLVGMFKNSSLYNPRKNPEGVINRRNVVLAQMEKNHYLTTKEKDSLQKLPLVLNFNPEGHNEGIATYFREYLRSYMKEWIEKNPKPDGSKYDIYSDGLKIYTTIDSRLQANAEEAVQKHMKNLQKAFFNENNPKKNKNFPFVNLSQEEINRIMERAMKNSDRWYHLKALGKSEKEIRASFQQKIPMQVFSWKGTIDTIMTPSDSIRYYKAFLRAAALSMEPQTGHIKAWVGGIDYKNFKYDQVIQGARQVGSAFKPFVYATAIDQLHYTPCDQLPDVKTCIEAGKYGNSKEWCPHNADGNFSGKMLTLKAALANSINSITANLMDKVGPVPVVKLVKKLGITADIPELPSIALGSADITLLEMVGAYGAFANEGVYVKPIIVTRIEDRNGRVLFEYIPETHDVVSADVANTVINLLEGVTHSGSGIRLRTKGADAYNAIYKNVVTGYPYAFTNPIAGKTGTTQNQSDGWFMGIVPNLVTGVWVGGEDRSVHFRGLQLGQGATMALPIWGYYMKKGYEDKDLGISKGAFPRPQGDSFSLNCQGNDPIEATGGDSESIEINF